jgi:hypothetical protein
MSKDNWTRTAEQINLLNALKNERDYIKQTNHLSSAVAAMNFAIIEIERQQAINADLLSALKLIERGFKNGKLPDQTIITFGEYQDELHSLSEIVSKAIAKATEAGEKQ